MARALTIGQVAKATGVAAKTLTITLDGRPRPAPRPRLLALVREQLSAVQHQIVELQLLQRQLEQVSHRLLTSPPQRQTD